MTKGFGRFLKYIACLAVFLSAYPVLAVKCSLLSQSAVRPAIDILVLVLIGFVGYFVGWITVEFSRKKPVMYKFFCILTLVVPIALVLGYIYLTAEFIVPDIVVCSAVASFEFLAGIFCGHREYGEILGKSFVPVNICLDLVAVVLLALNETHVNTIQFVIVLILILAISSIIGNQVNIDKLMERRRYDKKSLPKKIRLFNLGLLSVVFLIILLLMLFRKQIASLILFVRDIVVTAVGLVFRFFAWLDSLLATDRSQMGELGDDILQRQQNSYSELSTIIVRVLFVALIVFLIVKYGKTIMFTIKKAVFEIMKAISDFFIRFSRRQPAADESYYVDTEEYLNPNLYKDSDKSVKHRKNDFRKRYSEYVRMTSDEKKFRFGYALAVSALNEKYLSINSSDTPLEIYEKSKEAFDNDFFDITESYDLIRYGELNYTGDFSELDAILKVLCKK